MACWWEIRRRFRKVDAGNMKKIRVICININLMLYAICATRHQKHLQRLTRYSPPFSKSKFRQQTEKLGKEEVNAFAALTRYLYIAIIVRRRNLKFLS